MCYFSSAKPIIMMGISTEIVTPKALIASTCSDVIDAHPLAAPILNPEVLAVGGWSA